MELKNSEEEKEYKYFDPKMLRPGDGSVAGARTRTPFQVCGIEWIMQIGVEINVDVDRDRDKGQVDRFLNPLLMGASHSNFDCMPDTAHSQLLEGNIRRMGNT